jgi:hypothetical protein
VRGATKKWCVYLPPHPDSPLRMGIGTVYVKDRAEALALVVTLWKALWFLVRH